MEIKLSGAPLPFTKLLGGAALSFFPPVSANRPTHRLISAQVRMPQISGLKWKDQTHDLDVFRERKLK